MAEIVFTAEPGFDFASEEYRALFGRARCSAFQHPDWLAPLYRLARSHPVEPLVVVGRRAGSGELAAVVPLVRRRAGARIAIEYAFLEVTDYACPILDPAVRMGGGDLGRRFLRALGRFDRLEIAPVREDDLAAWSVLLPCAPAALGFGAHHLHVRAEPGASLRRKMRRLADGGHVTLDVVEPADIERVMAAARRFRAGRFRADPMQLDASFAFYAEVAQRGHSAGLARLYRLSSGNELVAALFGLVHRGRFCYLVLGCDYAQYARFSPGMIMFARVMEDWFDDGGRIFDFTIGDEAFKSALGCARTPMYRFLLAGDTPATARVAEHADA